MEASNSRIDQAKPQFAVRTQYVKTLRGVFGCESINGVEIVTLDSRPLDPQIIKAFRDFKGESRGGDVRCGGILEIPLCIGES